MDSVHEGPKIELVESAIVNVGRDGSGTCVGATECFLLVGYVVLAERSGGGGGNDTRCEQEKRGKKLLGRGGDGGVVWSGVI